MYGVPDMLLTTKELFSLLCDKSPQNRDGL